jgi:glycine oxidase
VTALVGWSQAQYGSLALELLEVSGVDPEYLQSGLLMLAPEDSAEALAWAVENNQEMQRLSIDEAKKIEPNLGVEQEALWMPRVGQVRNPRLLQGLAILLEKQGVVLRLNEPVTKLIIDNRRVSGVQTKKGVVQAENIVVAGGAWSRQILGDLGRSFEVEPVKGQMMLIKAQPGVVKTIVLGDGHYVIPRKDGHVLVGSTLEYEGFKKSITEAARNELLEAAYQLVPVLADFPVVNHWAGLRPGSPEGVPYIGAHPEAKGLYVSAGHFRNGLVMGPASARLLADIIFKREPVLDISQYEIFM